MSVIHGIFFGIGMLILTYLVVKNADGVASIFSSGGPQLGNTIKALQGR